MSRFVALIALSTVFALGCEEPAPQPTQPTSTAKKETAAATATSKAKAPEEKKDDPIKWAAFTGPEVKVEKADNVWCVLPVSDSFDSLKFAQTSVLEAQDNQLMVSGYKKTWVPGAFIRKVEEPTLTKGDPVLAAVYATGVHGRIVEIGDKVKVKLEWVGKAAIEEVDKKKVLKLSGSKLEFGEPVAYKEGTDWHNGTFIHQGGDKSWVLGWGGKPAQVATADIKNMTITKTFKAGDEVWAPFVGTLKPAKVVEVLDDGVRIKVEMEGKEETVSYVEVTAPLG